MTKKKILSLCMVAALATTAFVGGTLAYFTDTDSEDNVFTLGNVDIALEEKFEPEGTLMPDEKNKTKKEVYVTNEGTEPAYVRVHYAIPSALVDEQINSYNDILHVNMTKESIEAGEWSWLDEYSKDSAGWVGNGLDNNNTYTTKIDNVDHTVWVVTYTTAVKAGEKTNTPAISSVYMDKYVEATGNDDGSVTYTKPVFTSSNREEKDGDKVMTYNVSKGLENQLTTTIKVIAEGTQVDSFDDAYEALNTAFGKPGSYNPFVTE